MKGEEKSLTEKEPEAVSTAELPKDICDLVTRMDNDDEAAEEKEVFAECLFICRAQPSL